MNIYEGIICTPKAKIAIVISRFNHLICQNLLQGALDALKRQGQVKHENITVAWVPGAMELPFIAKRLGQSKKYDAIIALGCIIRGNTAHFDYVAATCNNGLHQASMETDTPITSGILTTDTLEQAFERAGSKAGNKGEQAALCALEMLNLLSALPSENL